MAKIGQIVVYNTTEDQRKSLEDETQKQVPAIITKINSDNTVNLQVLWDKEASASWEKSVKKGIEEGNYCPI